MNETPSALVSVRTQHLDNAVVVSASGELDMATTSAFADALDRVVLDGMHAMVVDLSEVVFFGSAALSVLIRLHRAATDRGLQLRVVCGPLVAKPLQLTGVDQLLNLFPSLDEALHNLTPNPLGS
ncbi:anti-sigma factor antagonist [Kutzneria viridogrisea]|uniref:Anti-sigma factor antagonist n=2 Tax=Kutzneria TaxID=43356 RepID=W5WAR7_9PSEU|nr:STAS domain-containing protein [Kutzneria albida]AHH98027.1 hypothetical protein KALB_4665 [Kutzneria albida DSM 43870]MBA8924315.1 anti-anti-sigma factor [Kutzneria viridogrisea]